MISRADLEESFYVDHHKRAMLAKGKRQKAERIKLKKQLRQRGISFADYSKAIALRAAGPVLYPSLSRHLPENIFDKCPQ